MEAKKESRDKGELVTVYNRDRITVTGVLNIESFDDEYVMLSVVKGRVAIEGQGLKVTSLSHEGGDINITGNIKAVGFFEANEGRRGRSRGIFK